MSTIVDHLVLEDGIRVSKQGVHQFLKCYGNRGTIARKPGSGLPGKLSPSIQQITELAMHQDDEPTATQLQFKLATYGLYISLTTILRNRHQLDWAIMGQPTASLYVRQTSKSGWTGHALTYMTALMTLYGAMGQMSS